MMITGNNIEIYRLLVLRQALKLEIQGIKVVRGTSAFKTLKKMGFEGNRSQVLAQLDELHAQIHRTTDEA